MIFSRKNKKPLRISRKIQSGKIGITRGASVRPPRYFLLSVAIAPRRRLQSGILRLIPVQFSIIQRTGEVIPSDIPPKNNPVLSESKKLIPEKIAIPKPKIATAAETPKYPIQIVLTFMVSSRGQGVERDFKERSLTIADYVYPVKLSSGTFRRISEGFPSGR